MERACSTPEVLGTSMARRLRLIGESVGVGLLAGLVVVAYRVLLEDASGLRTRAYLFLESAGAAAVTGWFMVLILAGVLSGWLLLLAPLAGGSGIPQVKGFLMRQVDLKWFRELLVKFAGGLLALGFGLSLGREGPSVQMGASTGLGFSRGLRRTPLEEKSLVTAGASAGLAAAFNSPLAGVVFALEELHRHFSPILLVSAMTASVTADLVSRSFFGLEPAFRFENLSPLPLSRYPFVLLLGILVAVLGKLFNGSLLWMQTHYGQNRRIPPLLRPVPVFVLAGVIGFMAPRLLGGGHHLIEELTHTRMLLGVLILLFLGKLLFTTFAYSSAVPGGIFLPILVLGALVGKGFGGILFQEGLIAEPMVINFMTLAMAAYFTAVVRAPITGSILITEMTGSFRHMLPLVVVSLVAYVVTDLIHSRSLYDVLLDRMMERKKPGRQKKNLTRARLLLEIPVAWGSRIADRQIREVDWPAGALIVGVRRGEAEWLPEGSMQLLPGDCLLVLVHRDDGPELKRTLLELGEHPDGP